MKKKKKIKLIKYFLSIKSFIKVIKCFTFQILVKHFAKTNNGFSSPHQIARSPI